MKSSLSACCLGILLSATGCADAPPASDVASPATNGPGESASSETDAPAAGDKTELTPENTSIAFVGNHTGDDPDPRGGSFQRFTGSAIVDGALKSVAVEIDTTSLTTEIEKLTNHLKSADFFDVNPYPKASFHSTSIEATGDGKVTITGDLTLLDTTKSITFPATVSLESGLALEASFEIDRTQWGMDYGTDNVAKLVEMTITIGE